MIEIKNLTKKYGDTTILSNTSYVFPQKGLICIMGASGEGKTTLLNLLAGFDSKYDGEIIVGGTNLPSLDADALCRYRKDNIGFVFQNYHLLRGYTVLENILLACELTGESMEQSKKKANTLLEKLGIANKENQKIENLSGGQKQRVAIARALINEPQIIFADEPTGALDRSTSTEIMSILKEIAKDKLVIVITHDQKICDFADEIIHIKEQKIKAERELTPSKSKDQTLVIGKSIKPPVLKRAEKNFKVHLKRYITVALAISIGMLAFLFSLSFGNVMDKSIAEFKGKNTAFNNGYIKGADDGTVFDFLKGDDRIENVYYQYKLSDLSLTFEEKTEMMVEKYPMPKATEGLSYGVMPRLGENEISLTPSLAKKFEPNIKNLIGQTITLKSGEHKFELTVSGIYNAGYDDFFISSDLEQQLYDGMEGSENYSISYDVKEFADIVAVNDLLKLNGISAETAAKEVQALQNTFHNLTRLFFVVSALILGIALFICIVLLLKLQSTRYREVGLLSALGFSRRSILGIISAENLMLSAMATGTNLILLTVAVLLGSMTNFPFLVNGLQVLASVAVTFAVVMIISGIASYQLVKLEPAEGLRA